MPDIFVPEDTAGYTPLLAELAGHQIFTAYVIDHLQSVLKKYGTAESFIRHFNLTDDDSDRFLLYASKTLKEMDSKEIRISKPYIKQYLKASAARFKWGDDAYYEVLNQQDLALQKAVQALK